MSLGLLGGGETSTEFYVLCPGEREEPACRILLGDPVQRLWPSSTARDTVS